jgi:hypothetical protein
MSEEELHQIIEQGERDRCLTVSDKVGDKVDDKVGDKVNVTENVEDGVINTVDDIVGDIVSDTVFGAEKEGINLNDTIRDTVNDTVSDTVNDTVKERLEEIVELLYQEPGLRSTLIAKRMGVSKVTIKRDMQKLRPLVTFEGPQKTGGFYLKEDTKARIERAK